MNEHYIPRDFVRDSEKARFCEAHSDHTIRVRPHVSARLFSLSPLPGRRALKERARSRLSPSRLSVDLSGLQVFLRVDVSGASETLAKNWHGTGLAGQPNGGNVSGHVWSTTQSQNIRQRTCAPFGPASSQAIRIRAFVGLSWSGVFLARYRLISLSGSFSYHKTLSL